MAQLDAHEHLLDLAEAIKPLPRTVVLLAIAVAEDDVGVGEVAAIVKGDPSLVAALLREANSAASGSTSRIETVERAIVRLGIARVLAIATKENLTSLPADSMVGYALDLEGMWAHTTLVSHGAEVIRAKTPVDVGPEVATAALLHDIGKIVLGQVLNAGHLLQARQHSADVTIAERELVDVDHAEIGALLLDLWHIPKVISEAVRFHHEPLLSEGIGAHVVHVADAIAHQLQSGAPAAGRPAAESSLSKLQIEWEPTVEAVVESFDDEMVATSPGG